MGTRWCLICGGEYIDTVDECPDCELPLVDERPDQDLADVGSGQVAYDLAAWSAESRVMLEQLLEGEGCRHAWEGTTLVVPDVLETQVDNLVEQVEVTALPTLDPDAERVAYDVSDWTDSMVTQLAQMLDQSGVPYEFDAEGDIVTQIDHEERVESLMDAIEYPADVARSRRGDDAGEAEEEPTADDIVDADEIVDEDEDDEEGEGEGADEGEPVEEDELVDELDLDEELSDELDDDDLDDDDLDEDELDDDDGGAAEDRREPADEGLNAASVLSDLFVASDRLQRNARDSKGVLTFDAAAERSQDLPLPYGFSPVVWKDIVNQVESIQGLLENDDSDDGEIKNQARDLRNTLRDYV
jgi:hypothetical protein